MTSEELMRVATEAQDAKVKARKMPTAPQRRNGNGHAPEPEPRESSGFLTLSEPLEWPGRGTVYVHPASLDDEMWAAEQAALAVNRQAEDRKEKLTEEQFRYRVGVYAKVYQVVAFVKTGEEPDSPQAFSPEDAAAFRTDPAYRRVIERALSISERLGSDDFLRTAYETLFFEIEARLVNCASALNDGSDLKTTSENLTALADFISLTRQRAALSVEGFPELIGAESEEESPAPELVEA